MQIKCLRTLPADPKTFGIDYTLYYVCVVSAMTCCYLSYPAVVDVTCHFRCVARHGAPENVTWAVHLVRAMSRYQGALQECVHRLAAGRAAIPILVLARITGDYLNHYYRCFTMYIIIIMYLKLKIFLLRCVDLSIYLSIYLSIHLYDTVSTQI